MKTLNELDKSEKENIKNAYAICKQILRNAYNKKWHKCRRNPFF